MRRTATVAQASAIELFGLPGSGKSAVVNAFMAEESTSTKTIAQPTPLRYRGRSRLGRLEMLVRVHLRSRSLAVVAYRLALSQGAARRIAVRRVPAFLVDVERMSHASRQLAPGESCILKQGALQQLRSLLVKPEQSDIHLLSIIDRIHSAVRPTLKWNVVVVDTSAATAAERVADRPYDLGRYDRLSHGERLEVFDIEHTVQSRIVEALRETGAANIYRIDGELALDEAERQASMIFHDIVSNA